MSRTFVRQETQIRNSDAYTDNTAPAATMESAAAHIEDDLNNLRSMVNYLIDLQSGNWYDTVPAPVTFEGGASRAVTGLNQDLHDLERKRVLISSASLADVTVPATQNYAVLGAGQLPSNTTAAVGAVTTLGTVVAAHAGTFGTHSLDEVTGGTTVSPKNLVQVVDGSTRDPILDSNGKQIWGLIQTENATDGHTITTAASNRAQVSFVVINATGDDLIACAVADIESQTVNFAFSEREALEDLNEETFLRGAIVDVPGASTVNRQVAYANQGATPVDLTTNAILDLEGPGLEWQIRDDLEALLFRVIEGSAGGTSEVEISADVDLFDVDAAVNAFANGATLNAIGTRPIEVGVTDGVIQSTAGDLRVNATTELYLDDGNQTGSTWAQTDGIKLSENTAEWDSFETNFGEVSLLNAINQAYSATSRDKTVAVVSTTTTAGVNVTGAGGSPNLDAQLGDYSGVTSFEDEVDVYLNGVLLRGDNSTTGANNHDVYPGSTPANGDLTFEFTVKVNDVVTMIIYDAAP